MNPDKHAAIFHAGSSHVYTTITCIQANAFEFSIEPGILEKKCRKAVLLYKHRVLQ
jgi:hypothetical protein